MTDPTITQAREGLDQLAQMARGLQYAAKIIEAVEASDRIAAEAEKRLAETKAKTDALMLTAENEARAAGAVIRDKMLADAQAEAAEIVRKANAERLAIEKSLEAKLYSLSVVEEKLETAKKAVAQHIERLSAVG